MKRYVPYALGILIVNSACLAAFAQASIFYEANVLTYLNPKPHKATFLKPFMTEQSAEFCSACHKVHLDVPVNSYRWQRGFNDYDNWQASGVSGQGARYYTQFAYAGVPKPGQDPSLLAKDHNSLEYDFNPHNIPANVSGNIRDCIPELPIVTLAKSEVNVPLGQPNWTLVVRKQDRERWNDWGIGLLLQGDLKGAEYAFRKVTEAEPEYADGWLNVARALIQEGETDAARTYLEKAASIAPQFGRIWFFKAAVQKADGDYDSAVTGDFR